MTSKASRYAEAVKAEKAMWVKPFRLNNTNVGEVLASGGGYIGRAELSADEALALAAWINETFGESEG